ncbi:hypothetical protein VULLAG_LOCUS2979 [Vulpes lagopus]
MGGYHLYCKSYLLSLLLLTPQRRTQVSYCMVLDFSKGTSRNFFFQPAQQAHQEVPYSSMAVLLIHD